MAGVLEVSNSSLMSNGFNSSTLPMANSGAEQSTLDENSMFRAMVEHSLSNIIQANRDFEAVSMNQSSFRTLSKIQHLLPIPVNRIVGSSIDQFHVDPQRVRKILENPKNLPHQAKIRVGPETLELLVNASFDAQGNYLGPFVTWSVVSEQEKSRRMEADSKLMARASEVLNALSRPEYVLSALVNSVAESLGANLASYWKLNDARSELTLQADGLRRGEGISGIPADTQLSINSSIYGKCVNENDVVTLALSSDSSHSPRINALRGAKVQTLVLVPVRQKGAIVGILEYLFMQPYEAFDDRLQTLRPLSGLASSCMEKVHRSQLLGRAVNELLAIVEAAAHKDLTRTPELVGDPELDRLAEGVSKMMGDLRTIIAEVVLGAEQFSEGANVIAQAA